MWRVWNFFLNYFSKTVLFFSICTGLLYWYLFLVLCYTTMNICCATTWHLTPAYYHLTHACYHLSCLTLDLWLSYYENPIAAILYYIQWAVFLLMYSCTLEFSNLSCLVLNIVRDGRDIVRYLLFCLLPIRYGKIVRHIVCSKKRPIFEISADKSPDIGQ